VRRVTRNFETHTSISVENSHKETGMKTRVAILMMVLLAAAATVALAVDILKVPYADCQEVEISGTSAQTENAIKANWVGVYATVDCYVAIGSNPVATASGNGNIFLPAGTFISTQCRQNDKVGAITGGDNGKLYVYPLR